MKHDPRIKVVLQEISSVLQSLGFQGQGEITINDMRTGVRHFKRINDGSISFAFAVDKSTNRALFVTAKIAITSDPLDELLVYLEKDCAGSLRYPYGSLAWSVGETTAEFDPSVDHNGTEFSFNDESFSEELSLAVSRVSLWIAEVENYLIKEPVFDFYRFDRRIDQDYRWRELVAILKVLRGEEYVGYQLFNDLLNEAAGLNPIYSDYEGAPFKIFGLRSNEIDLAFRKAVYLSMRTASKEGLFTKTRLRIESSLHEKKQQPTE